MELASGLSPAQLDLRALLHTELEAALQRGEVVDAVPDRDAALWGLRHAVSEALRARGVVIGFDISLPRRAVWPFRQAAMDWLAACFAAAELCDFGHLGDGGQHFNLVWPSTAPALTTEAQRRLRDGVYALVAEHGGSFSAEHGLGPLLVEPYRLHTDPEVQALTTRCVQPLTAGRRGPGGFF